MSVQKRVWCTEILLMNLLKSASLILCMIVIAGCSSKGEKKPSEAAAPVAPKVDYAWLDEYEPKLRDALVDSRFEVERRDNVLVVTAPVDSSFNPDRPGMLLPVTLGPITRVAKLVEKDEDGGRHPRACRQHRCGRRQSHHQP